MNGFLRIADALSQEQCRATDIILRVVTIKIAYTCIFICNCIISGVRKCIKRMVNVYHKCGGKSTIRRRRSTVAEPQPLHLPSIARHSPWPRQALDHTVRRTHAGRTSCAASSSSAVASACNRQAALAWDAARTSFAEGRMDRILGGHGRNHRSLVQRHSS